MPYFSPAAHTASQRSRPREPSWRNSSNPLWPLHPDRHSTNGMLSWLVSTNPKNGTSRTHSPSRSAIVSSALGPCTPNGDTSGSNTRQSRSRSVATARHQSSRSLSAIEIQNRSSASFSTIGSLMSIPSWSHIGAYRTRPAFMPRRSRADTYWQRAKASGPTTSTWRSAATSHSETRSTSALYSSSGSPNDPGMYMWL